MNDQQPNTARLLQAKALEYINDGVMIVDPQGHVIYADPSMLRILGMSQDDLRKHADRINERTDFRGGLSFDDILKTVQDGGSWSGEATCQGDGDRMVMLDINVQRLDDAGGESLGAIVVARDVTRERALEKQVVQSQQMELVENLTIGIAHEFKNLLTVILAYATLLQEETKATSCEQDIKNIMETVERANDLTARLLAVTRISAPRDEPIQIQKVLDDVVGVMQRTLPKDITVYAPENVRVSAVSGDSSILYRALLNLCLNARDAMPDGGTISIEADTVHVESEDLETWPDRMPGEYVILAVTDTGKGMPMEVKKRIFEPFFSTKKHGTGLGLSVVQHSLASIGGWITVYSEPDLGTCVRLYLPVAGAEGEEEEPEAAKESGGTETVMVVDDDPMSLSVARRCLENAGYKVLPASGAEKAIAVFRQRHSEIDLVLLDVVMPYMNGDEVYRELIAIRPDTKVVAVSGFAPKSAQRLLRAPGVRFLAKPYTRARLCGEVRKVLDNA